MILKHFEEEEKLPISSWHHVFHSVESQLPASLAQEGLSVYRVAEPKSQFQIPHTRVERRRDVQELLHWCKKRIRPNHVNSSFLCVQRRSSTPLRLGMFWVVHIPTGRVTSFDCVWHCLGETHGHSTSPQETSVKCNCALNTHIHRVSLEKSERARGAGQWEELRALGLSFSRGAAAEGRALSAAEGQRGRQGHGQVRKGPRSQY